MDDDVKIGDTVQFELEPRRRVLPRWNGYNDSGYSGVFRTGEITAIGDDSFTVEFAKTTWIFLWETLDNPKKYPGAPTLLSLHKAARVHCECGGAKTSGTHSHWCPVKK
jgi:hypothetical protein